MNLTNEEIDKIIENNCGNPPDVEKLKYSIWLNNWKYEHYSKARRNSIYRTDKEYNDNLDSYKRPVKKAIRYRDLDIHRRINARANCFIHGLYYKGNNYAAYPMRYDDVKNSGHLTSEYFIHYFLNVGREVLWRRDIKAGKLF